MLIPAAALLARGPITALTILVSTATFSAGAFFVALRNTKLDCAEGSATHAACAVDILTDVVTAIVGAGATAGAAFIGLTTPTPRDGHGPIFRVDGVDVDWYTNANYQRHGLNRTIDNPAVIEWQWNHTAPVKKYITYFKDGYLVQRMDSGIDIPDPTGKRGTCRAYYDLRYWGNDLKNNEFASTPSSQDWLDAAHDIYYQFVDREWQAGCVKFVSNQQSNGGVYETQFELGGSCEQYEPANLNCGSADYNYELMEYDFRK